MWEVHLPSAGSRRRPHNATPCVVRRHGEVADLVMHGGSSAPYL
jgi:hypothetical protein